MSMTDPIADLLTRIRNAQAARHETLVVPASRVKRGIVAILKAEGFLQGYLDDSEAGKPSLKLFLKYDDARKGAIRGLVRVSCPSRRVYVGRESVPAVRNGLGIAILTTSKGLLTDSQARRAGLGGEVICHVW